MICVVDCGECKHQKPLIDGWRPCCDAFPDGIPMDFDYSKVKEIKECNNGIGFEPIEQNKN
ncbi:MAG: glutamyl-tRNA amidotransferase [Ruminococcus sp.]|nr:glutamyl-tRNA amidotransferase [Ruminococcus sp.]